MINKLMEGIWNNKIYIYLSKGDKEKQVEIWNQMLQVENI